MHLVRHCPDWHRLTRRRLARCWHRLARCWHRLAPWCGGETLTKIKDNLPLNDEDITLLLLEASCDLVIFSCFSSKDTLKNCSACRDNILHRSEDTVGMWRTYIVNFVVLNIVHPWGLTVSTTNVQRQSKLQSQQITDNIYSLDRHRSNPMS